MSDLTNYIYVFDLKNVNGCEVSIHGNGEKLAMMYDQLTKRLCIEAPSAMLRLMATWDKN
jgi:hypothetical protein